MFTNMKLGVRLGMGFAVIVIMMIITTVIAITTYRHLTVTSR